MGGDAQGLQPPVGQTIERADAQPAEAGSVGALGGFQAPVKITLRTGGMHFGVDGAVVGFLINDQPVRTCGHERPVIFGLHGADFQRDARPIGVQGGDAVAQVIIGNKLGMFAGHEQQIAEPLGFQLGGLAADFIQ